MEYLLTYYGLDWLSSILGLWGLHLVTEQRSVGFLLSAGAVVLAASVAIMAGQYGFLLANIATFTISLRGYHKWQRSAVPVEVEVVAPGAEAVVR